jgi:glycosyltransferase involved in cell wall biosynthesis
MRNPIIVQACTGYPPDRIGGIERVVGTLNESINHLGFNSMVITRLSKKEVKHPRVIQVKTPSKEILGYLVWTVRALFLIRNLKPDLVHCHGLHGALVCIALYPYRTKTIMHVHNAVSREPGYEYKPKHKLGLFILKTAIILSDLAICPTYAAKNDLVQHLGAKVQRKVLVVPNFTQEPENVSEEEIQEVKGKYGLVGKKIILYFGKIKSTKGIENMCKAYRIMALRKESRLVLAGMPTATDRYLNKLKSSYPEVVFTGYVDKPSVFYRIANIFCIYTTSFGGGETFALTLADAMRHGVPIVASDNPVYREVTNNFAIYVNPDDPASLAKAFDFALQHSDFIRSNTIQAKRYADSVYNEENFLRSIQKIYKWTLSKYS